MGDNVTRTSDRFGGYGSELTADQLAAIQGANDPSATNVFITEDDLSDLPAGSDEKVKYNTDDPTAGYLADKIIAGTNVTIEEGTGADENKLKISATIGSTTDELVKYNAGDPTGGYLADKVINGDGVTISEGVGADENKVVVSNSDKGSTAVGSHELAYDHTKIKDYVEAVTSTNDDQFPISYLSYTKGGVSYDVTEIPKPNGLIYGGGVSWVELLKFDVSAAAYYLDGVLYTTDSAQVTLDPADGLLPRIDIIIVDTSETVSIITGVPNANPQKPTVDPITQIELTNILVPEGATEPGITITQEIIYNENTEWVGSSSGVTVDFTNAARPYDKTIATLVGTLTNNDTVTYTKSATSVAHESFENFIFNIRLNATVANQHNLYVRWLEDGVSVSNEVRVPLNKSNITSYQNINMSLSLWTWNQNNVDAVQFRWSRSGWAASSHVGFYLDLLKLEKGITVVSGSSGIELTGDVTGSGVTGTPVNTTLATINSNIGTFGDASNIPQVTVDGKGRITAISNVAVSTGDEKVKYDAGDPTAGYLSDKVVAGTNITIEEGTGGDVNKLKISSTASAADEKVKYNASDTSAGYLADKIIAGTGISLAEGTGGDVDKLVITNSITPIVNHNDLGEIDGGSTGEYYHLTAAQHSIATNAADTDNDGYLTQTDWDTFNGKQDALSAASVSDINTGTDATKYIRPDELAGSNLGTKSCSVQVIGGATSLTTGDGKAYIPIPAACSGMDLISCSMQVIVKSTSGLPSVMLARGRQANATSDFTYADMLSTILSIDANEYDSKDATTPAVINTSNDDVVTGDVIRVDCDIAGTGTKGLGLTLNFRLP